MRSFTVVVAQGIEAVENVKTVNIAHGMTSGQLGGKVQVFVETQNPTVSVDSSEKNPDITCDGAISGDYLLVTLSNKYTGNIVWKIYVTHQGKVEI